MAQYQVEFCSHGGTFGLGTVEASTPSEAVEKMNRSSLVGIKQGHLTRARIWSVGGVDFADRKQAQIRANATGQPVFAGVSR